MGVGVSVWLGWSGIRVAVVLQPATQIPLQPNHTETPTPSNQVQYGQCTNSTEESQAPDDGYNNVRNMLST